MRFRNVLPFLVLAMSAVPAFAQADPGQGGRNRPDPQQFRQRMEQRLKDEMGLNDDEWKALQPKIENVMKAQRDVNAGRFAMWGRRNRDGGDNASTPTSPVQDKAEALQKVLDNKDAKPEEVKAALAALRDARTEAKANLAKAQAELRDVLTVRQESVLVMMGMLD